MLLGESIAPPFRTRRCLPLRCSTAGCLNVLPPPGDAPLRYRDDVFTNVTTTTNITYGSATNQAGQVQSLELDVYRPAGDTVTSRPAIVWIHGGGFSGGNKTSPEIVAQAQAFARKGYVNVSIEYRLVAGGCSAGGVTQACLQAIVDAQHDAQAAVRFLRANASTYGIDTTRIASAGTSAGAITALHVAYNSEDPGTSGNPGPSSAVRSAVSLSGARFIGPITAADPPSLLFHGTNDTVVPYQWAVNTVERGQRRGCRCRSCTRSRARATSRSRRQLPDHHRRDPQLPLLDDGPRERRPVERPGRRHSGR